MHALSYHGHQLSAEQGDLAVRALIACLRIRENARMWALLERELPAGVIWQTDAQLVKPIALLRVVGALDRRTSECLSACVKILRAAPPHADLVIAATRAAEAIIRLRMPTGQDMGGMMEVLFIVHRDLPFHLSCAGTRTHCLTNTSRNNNWRFICW
jgi:hypothetical protein